MSLAAVFEYAVDPAGAAAFEAMYGGDGEWARSFAGAEGYLGTEMLRGADGHYLVIDRWRSAASRSSATQANVNCGWVGVGFEPVAATNVVFTTQEGVETTFVAPWPLEPDPIQPQLT